MLSEAIFIARVLPKGFSVISGKPQFSISFELNKEHKVFNQEADFQANKNEWLNKVYDFPSVIADLLEQSFTVRLQNGVANGHQAIIKNRAAYNVAMAQDLWKRFLSIPNLRQPGFFLSSEFAELNKTVNQFLQRPAAVDFTSALVPQPVLTGHGSLTLEKSSFTSIADVSVSLAKSFENLNPISEALKDGIEIAFKANKEKNNLRNISLKTSALKNWYGTFRQSFGISYIKDEGDEKMNPKSFRKQVDSLILAEAAAKALVTHPLYVETAFDKLNSAATIRYFLGTLIDFELADTPQTFGINVELHTKKVLPDSPPEPNGVEENYFFAPGYTQIIRKDDIGYPFMCAAPISNSYQNFFTDSFIKLKNRSIVLSIETESLSKNKTLVQEFLNETGDSVKSTDLSKISFQQPHTSAFIRQSPHLKMETLANIALKNQAMKVVQRANKQLLDVPTKGLSLYIIDSDYTGYNPNADQRDNNEFYEHDLVAGFVIYVRRVGSGLGWKSITRIRESLIGPGGTVIVKEGSVELAINFDAVIHAADQATNTIKGISNGFMFNWDGTVVSAKNPLRVYEREEREAPEDEELRKLEELHDGMQENPIEQLSVFKNTKKILGFDWFPFKKYNRQASPDYILKRDFERTENPGTAETLKFGAEFQYEFLAIAQYQNGYSAITENQLNSMHQNETLTKLITDCKTSSYSLYRHDHIKNILSTLEMNIFGNDGKTPLKNHLGESATDLVVRTGELVNNESCTRYILPPPIPTFNLYLWYNMRSDSLLVKNNRNLSDNQLYKWSLRYLYQGETNALVQPESWLADADSEKDADDTDPISGIDQGPVYTGRLKYLPDPVVSGVYLQFFLDRDCTIDADRAEYPNLLYPFAGAYPRLEGIHLKLLKDNKEDSRQIKVTRTGTGITVKLRRGMQLYAKIAATYFHEESHFFQSFVNEEQFANTLKEGEMEYHYNELFANVTVLSFTHASQKPLFKPVIQHVEVYRYPQSDPRKQSFALFKTNLHFEHLNLWYGIPVPDTQSTGELEMYGLWDDYSENKRGAHKTMAEKRDNDKIGGGFIFISRIEFGKDDSPANVPSAISNAAVNPLANYWKPVLFSSDGSFSPTHYTDFKVKVRNTSRFANYFLYEKDQTAESKEQFSLWSDEFTLGKEPKRRVEATLTDSHADYFYNNRKPEIPKVAKIIPQTIRDQSKNQLVMHGNRVRFYLEKEGCNYSGKEERIGILVADEQTVYPSQLQGFISQAGIDVVTDDVSSRLDVYNKGRTHQNQLTRYNFQVEKEYLEDEYNENFQPLYDRTGTTPHQDVIGVISYLPLFDEKLQLWYVDIQFDIRNTEGRQMHSTFVQLSLVHYQPCASCYGYRQDTTQDMANDNRISNPVKTNFFCIYPSRSINNYLVLFGQRQSGNFSLSGDVSSLYFKNDELRSQFYICIENKTMGNFSIPRKSIIKSRTLMINGETVLMEPININSNYHPLIPISISIYARNVSFECSVELEITQGDSDYQVVVYEVDYFHDKEKLYMLDQLLYDMDIHQIDQVYIRNVYIINQ